jgi:hypothetical protein
MMMMSMYCNNVYSRVDGRTSFVRYTIIIPQYQNLAIDFGAATAFAVLDVRVEERIQQKKQQKKVSQMMKDREQGLGLLKLDIQVSSNGETREASVKELQAGAKQHMIIVAGPKKACRDALVGANLMKMDFAMRNVLVVPFQTDKDPLDARPEKGFGDRPIYERQAYVARTTGDNDAWTEYIEEEMADAVKQNGESVRNEGIAVVVASNGKVIRRGVGTVPWRQMVEQLEEVANEK